MDMKHSNCFSVSAIDLIHLISWKYQLNMLTCTVTQCHRMDLTVQIEMNASHKVDTARFAGEAVGCLSLHYGKQTWLQWETFDEICCFITLVASAHTAVDSWIQRCHILCLFWRVFPSWPELCLFVLNSALFPVYFIKNHKSIQSFTYFLHCECKGFQKRKSLCHHIHIKCKLIWRACDVCGLISFPLAASTRLQPCH